MTKPKYQPKARYFTCRNCNVAGGGTSADVIHTMKSKRQLQQLRRAERQRQPNQQNQQPNQQQPNQNGNGNARLISKTVRIVKTNQAQRPRNNQAKAKAMAKEAREVRSFKMNDFFLNSKAFIDQLTIYFFCAIRSLFGIEM